MKTAEARKVFDQAAKAAADKGDAEAVARIELSREYFTNPEFRKWLENAVWQVNGGTANG